VLAGLPSADPCSDILAGVAAGSLLGPSAARFLPAGRISSAARRFLLLFTLAFAALAGIG